MKFLIGFATFIGTFLIYQIIGFSIFPVDENNVLQAPGIYPIIGVALCVCATVFAVKMWKRTKSTNDTDTVRASTSTIILSYIVGTFCFLAFAFICIIVGISLGLSILLTMENISITYLTSLFLLSLCIGFFAFVYFKRLVRKKLAVKGVQISENTAVYIENQFPTSISPTPPSDVIDTTYMSSEEKYSAALSIVYEMGVASISALQHRLDLGYAEAARLIDRMEDEGIISPFEGAHPRRVYKKGEKPSHKTSVSMPATALAGVDIMEGHDFEEWCADILRKNGFINVEVTPGSGDQGVDVLAEKDGIGYAIQCKCYSKDLGNTPVQEVSSGKAMYERPIGVVMTNRYFTEGARQLAKKTMTLLWDRDKLQELIEHANSHI